MIFIQSNSSIFASVWSAVWSDALLWWSKVRSVDSLLHCFASSGSVVGSSKRGCWLDYVQAAPSTPDRCTPTKRTARSSFGGAPALASELRARCALATASPLYHCRKEPNFIADEESPGSNCGRCPLPPGTR